MVQRERVTVAVLAVLVAVGGWFASVVRQDGLGANHSAAIIGAVVAIAVLSAALAALAAATGGSRRVDERDHRVAMMSQTIRGFFYLGLSFGVLGLLWSAGQYALVNGIFLAILAIEIVSGIIMLALYRVSA